MVGYFTRQFHIIKDVPWIIWGQKLFQNKIDAGDSQGSFSDLPGKCRVLKCFFTWMLFSRVYIYFITIFLLEEPFNVYCKNSLPICFGINMKHNQNAIRYLMLKVIWKSIAVLQVHLPWMYQNSGGWWQKLKKHRTVRGGGIGGRQSKGILFELSTG